LLTWFGICFTYIQFHKGLKAQGIDRHQFPYASKFNPYAAYFAAVSIIFICIFSGWSVFLKGSWDTATFVTNYLPLVLFPIFYFTARYINGVPLVKPADMDFKSGLAEIEADTYVFTLLSWVIVNLFALGMMNPHRRTSLRSSGVG
jgi:yeast amino acid transporter